MILYYIDSEWTISIIRSLMSLLDRNHDIQEDHPRIISQSNLVWLDFGFFHLLAAFTGDQCMIFFEMLLSLALIERLWALVAEDDVPKAEGLVHKEACQVDLLLAIFTGKKILRFINLKTSRVVAYQLEHVFVPLAKSVIVALMAGK